MQGEWRQVSTNRQRQATLPINLHLHRLARDPEAAEAVRCVARSRGVTVRSMLSRTRGSAEVAAARQLAMYLLHVGLGRPQDVVALLRRHPSTISHACHAVEDRRDDPAFEAEVAALEARISQRGDEALRHAS